MSEHSDRHHRTVSLSARLLILTVVFVMIAEVMIWTPSVARFRKNFIEDYIARSYLSMVALDSMPETQPNQDLEMELLHQTEALAIIVNRPDRRMLLGLEYEGGPVGSLLFSCEVPSLFKGLRLSRIWGREGSLTFESNGLLVIVRIVLRRRHPIAPAQPGDRIVRLENGDPLMPAVGTGFDVATQSGGATSLDR